MNFPQWDIDLFLLINGLHNPLLDTLMWHVSGAFTFLPLYILVLVWLCRRAGWRKSIFIVLGAALCIVLADRISSGLIKPAFERLRPTHEPSLVGMVHILRGYAGGKYGFVSSHAANHFAFAVYSLLLVRRWWYGVGVCFIAFLISYSRIYLGVHYPLDVICGGAVGAIVGAGMYGLYALLLKLDRPARKNIKGTTGAVLRHT